MSLQISHISLSILLYMSEEETKSDLPVGKSGPRTDVSFKWYYIFAAVLFMNLCGVGYAYYYKFYKNKSAAETTNADGSVKVNILPTDTVYVDNIDDYLNKSKKDVDAEENDDATIDGASTTAAGTSSNGSNDIVANTSGSNTQKAKEMKFSFVSPSDNQGSESGSAKDDNNTTTAANNKSLPKSIRHNEEESHTFLISMGMFKVKDNAQNLISELKQKGILGEMISSDHFEKLPHGYLMVIGGKELSSASAYQMCGEMKKKGINCDVTDAGKYSWR